MDAYHNGSIKITLLAMLALIIFLGFFSTVQSDEIASPIPAPTPDAWIPDPNNNCGGMIPAPTPTPESGDFAPIVRPAQCLYVVEMHFAFLPMIESELLNE